ncbi:MAG TPA: lipoyl(octanoyl) transferase LipB [Candidatus Acidoferrales bacterium]|jgi:lipoyl(octanoyl) transferase|nr:lipoyl(octanoyl) transferase LipB [Candidatus Acidoferrales bacterium]
MKELLVVDLGLVEYGAAWELQRRVAAARKAGAMADVLLLCEHPHVITLGRSGKISNLRVPDEMLRQMGVSFFETNRGGDITYHGPGQLVGYPILNLSEIRRDVAWYVRSLEESMIRAAFEFGVVSKRVPGCTGVWVDVPAAAMANGAIDPGKEARQCKDEEKLGAIGVHLSRWVTSHGFAYNVSTNLRYFDLIVPCGIAGKRATSLEKLLGSRVEVKEAAPGIVKHFAEIFALEPRTASRNELEAILAQQEGTLAKAAK